MSAQARGRPRVDFERYKDTLYRLYITERRPLDVRGDNRMVLPQSVSW
jgi:hypothetical protein